MQYKSNIVYFIKYSRILSIPVLGAFLYFIQLHLLKLNLITFIVISNKKSKQKTDIFSYLSHNNIIVFCRSYLFGPNLIEISAKKILDITIDNLELLSIKDLYTLAWSIIASDYITINTFHSLKENYLEPTISDFLSPKLILTKLSFVRWILRSFGFTAII